MIDTGKLMQSGKTLQILGNELDPFKYDSYTQAGVYYHAKANWYFFTDGTSVQGIPKALFESAFIEVDPKPTGVVDVDGIKEEIFLKTVALLSGRASEFKDL